MAIGSRKSQTVDQNTVPKDGVKEVSNIATEPLKTSVVDEFRIPRSHLLQYGEGSPWAVNYYRQVLGGNDPMVQFDPGVVNPSQQYENIEGLVIDVSSALESSQDQTTKVFTVKGRGIISNSVIPNQYDVFVAEIGDGGYGVFSVDSTTRMSYNKVAAYEVEYTMLFKLTSKIQNALDGKAVRSFVYESKRISLLEDPIMPKEAHSRFVGVLDAISYLKATYPLDFYNRDLQSLQLPVAKEQFITYDVFLTHFARSIGLTDTTTSYTIYPHPPYDIADIRTVWWQLLNQMPRGKVESEFVNYTSYSFRGNRTPGSIGWSLAAHTYFPKHLEVMNVSVANVTEAVGQPSKLHKSKEDFQIKQLKSGASVLNTKLPMVLPIDDDLYVFSKAFYDGKYASSLEQCMRMYLKREPIDVDVVLELTEFVDTLPDLERFYYAPVCMLLLMYVR